VARDSTFWKVSPKDSCDDAGAETNVRMKSTKAVVMVGYEFFMMYRF
jgi:hypothetical protein